MTFNFLQVIVAVIQIDVMISIGEAEHFKLVKRKHLTILLGIFRVLLEIH